MIILRVWDNRAAAVPQDDHLQVARRVREPSLPQVVK
jgi:hypothetical protein